LGETVIKNSPIKIVFKLLLFFIIVLVGAIIANAAVAIVINVYYGVTLGNHSQAIVAANALLTNIWVQAFTALLQNAVFVLVALAFLRSDKEKSSLERFGLKFTADAPKRFLTGMGIDLVMFLSVVAVILLVGFATYQGSGINVFGLSSVTLSLIAMAIATLSVGFGEEILFRGYLQRMLTNRYGIAIALPVAAGIFVLVHMLPYFLYGEFTLMAFIAILPIALTLGYLFYKTGSLWICIGFHFLEDFLAVGVFFQGNMFSGTSPLFILSDPKPILASATWLGNWADVIGFVIMTIILVAIVAYYQRFGVKTSANVVAGN
jgi:uncharacterized protein